MLSFLKKYSNKFRYAFAGLFAGIRNDSSILLQCIIGCCVILVCLFLHLTWFEWSLIILLIGSIIALEFINSAIETIVDMISPEYNVLAKKIKDYAAAAVLIMSIVAAIIGILIVGGKL
ncbi:MAG: diacylglycerol kinase family protein [Longicatena sp.]